MAAMQNVREIALNLLEKIEKAQSYSNLLLNDAIQKNRLPKKDTGLLTELTYGTLQRKLTLDFYLQPFLKKGMKIESWVRQLLRLSLYQMVYLDRIPDRAAIHEAVEIAKKRGHRGIAGFVNGVLRNIQRNGLPSLDKIKDPYEKLAIETSHPLWLVKRWAGQFGFEKTKKMCEMNLIAPLQTARVNLTKISRNEAVHKLQAEGCQVEESVLIPEGLKVLEGNVAHSNSFKEGLITIQDESSMIVAYALGIEGGETVLDACAAPGGKSTHIGEKLNNGGKVTALDIHKHKVKLIIENAERLGLTNIEAKILDSRMAGEHFAKESFDRILVDAPCSGFGVMRRKPDLKYTKTEEDIKQLSAIQLDILESVAPLLKKGGILVYSTCTVDKEENDLTVEKFLQRNEDFAGDTTLADRLPERIRPFVEGFRLQIFPQDFGSDGFYIACLRKKVE